MKSDHEVSFVQPVFQIRSEQHDFWSSDPVRKNRIKQLEEINFLATDQICDHKILNYCELGRVPATEEI